MPAQRTAPALIGARLCGQPLSAGSQLKQLAALHRVAKTGRNQLLYNISIR